MSTCYINPNPRLKPSIHLISSITRSTIAVITTNFSHDYVSGAIVRFFLPTSVGMKQLNKKKAEITVINDTSFSVDIDTSKFDTFSVPALPIWKDNTCALVIPVGEISSQLTSAVQDVSQY